MPGGRPSLPIGELKFRGTYRTDRHADAEKAERGTPPLQKLPSCPKSFTPDEKAAWKRKGRDLISRGVLTSPDLSILADYCAIAAIKDAASRELAAHAKAHPENPTTDLGAQGRKPHPCILIIRQATAELRKYDQEFGTTPAARRRVPPPSAASSAKPDANPFAATRRA